MMLSIVGLRQRLLCLSGRTAVPAQHKYSVKSPSGIELVLAVHGCDEQTGPSSPARSTALLILDRVSGPPRSVANTNGLSPNPRSARSKVHPRRGVRAWT